MGSPCRARNVDISAQHDSNGFKERGFAIGPCAVKKKYDLLAGVAGQSIPDAALQKGHQRGIIPGNTREGVPPQGTGGDGVVWYRDAFREAVFPPVRVQVARFQVQGPVGAIEQPRVDIKLIGHQGDGRLRLA